MVETFFSYHCKPVSFPPLVDVYNSKFSNDMLGLFILEETRLVPKLMRPLTGTQPGKARKGLDNRSSNAYRNCFAMAIMIF